MKNKKEQKLTRLLEQKVKEVFLMGEYLNDHPELFKEEDYRMYSDMLRSLEYLELITITLDDEKQSIKIETIFL